jgi:anthranilate synthase component 1
MSNELVFPDFETFERNFKNQNTQILWTEYPSDLETPIGAYLKLCGAAPYSFLLESVEGGNVLGRYSIIGFAPDLHWRCQNGKAQVSRDGQNWTTESTPALDSLRAHIKACHIDCAPDNLPPMAVSGLFGYIGYDMIRLVENIPSTNPDDLNIPDSVLIRPSVLGVFDNVKQNILLVTPVYTHTGYTEKTAQEIYQEARETLKQCERSLKKAIDETLIHERSTITTPLNVQSNMTREHYHDAVKNAVRYIYDGEIFQVVPSQRFSTDFDLSSLALYRSLRRLNPSPFLFHIHFNDFQLVGASPEILVRVRDGEVTIRPIAGTRKRGETPAEDQALAEELLADPKERAEHLMLLDLGRNDIGRVSEFGSAKVTDSFFIERYSHVMHIVSNVTGRLKKSLDIVDALFAGFPAGTVSGAPKIRAMEIIDELEVSKRSFYAGGVGYFSGNGTLDTCIALRTCLLKDGKLYLQAGGGVVADSDAEAEYQETINKSKALIRSAEIAIEQAQKR